MNDLIKRLKFPHYIFTLKSSLDICIERDNERKKPHGKEATEAVYKKSTEFDAGVIIDATKPIKECIKVISSYLPKP